MVQRVEITRRNMILATAAATAVGGYGSPLLATTVSDDPTPDHSYKFRFKSRIIKLPDADIEILEAGTGPTTFVTTHPYLNESAPYPGTGLSQALAASGRTIYVAPRGTGRSSPETREDKLTMSQLVDDMEAIRVILGIDKWVPAGTSTGGMVVLIYGLRYPSATSGLFPICTAASYHWVDDINCLYNPNSVTFKHLEEIKRTQGDAARADASLYASLHTKTVYPGLQKVLKDSPARSAAVVDEVLGAKWDVMDKLSGIKVPTLVIAGRYDEQSGTLKPSFDIVSRIATSEYAIFNSSGHFPYDEEPARFASVISEFTRRRLAAA